MHKILLIYFSFVIACIVVIAAFITATTYTQLAIAIALYPLFVFFAYKFFPRKYWICTSKKPTMEAQSATKAEKLGEIKVESIGISDIDKRVFLKLIGGVGLSLILFSIFNKKADSLFFRSLPGSGSVSTRDGTGNKIDPYQKQSLDDYNISDIDNNIITFYGFIKHDGSWYIMRVDTTTGAFRYIKDNSNFSDNWNNRGNLKYDYFDNVFSTLEK